MRANQLDLLKCLSLYIIYNAYFVKNNYSKNLDTVTKELQVRGSEFVV